MTPPLRLRLFVWGVIVAGTSLIPLVVLAWPPTPSLHLLVLALAGVAMSSRNIDLGGRLHLSVAHPFLFAALVMDGPGSALLVTLLCVLGATLLRQRVYHV